MATLGQALREEREARGISLEEIAAATKIVSRYLQALEDDRLDVMPGGFFIRGIIRTYAKAVGLDGDEVLERYRSAGLLGEAAAKRPLFQRPAPPPVPSLDSLPIPPPPPAAGAAPDAEAVDLDLSRGAEPGPAAEPAPAAAARRGLSPAARRRILSWAWRGAVAVAVIAAIVFLWSSRRPRPPQGPAAAASGPAAPSAQPAAMLATEPPPAPATRPDLPPVVEAAWKGVTIDITFQAETWIRVYADGVLKLDGLFPAGATARAQADGLLLVHVGNAGGFTFLLNGKPARPLGRLGQVRTDIRITPENYKNLLEGPPPGQPGG